MRSLPRWPHSIAASRSQLRAAASRRGVQAAAGRGGAGRAHVGDFAPLLGLCGKGLGSRFVQRCITQLQRIVHALRHQHPQVLRICDSISHPGGRSRRRWPCAHGPASQVQALLHCQGLGPGLGAGMLAFSASLHHGQGLESDSACILVHLTDVLNIFGLATTAAIATTVSCTWPENHRQRIASLDCIF